MYNHPPNCPLRLSKLSPTELTLTDLHCISTSGKNRINIPLKMTETNTHLILHISCVSNGPCHHSGKFRILWNKSKKSFIPHMIHKNIFHDSRNRSNLAQDRDNAKILQKNLVVQYKWGSDTEKLKSNLVRKNRTIATKRYFSNSSRIISISDSRFEAHTSRISIVLPSTVLNFPLAHTALELLDVGSTIFSWLHYPHTTHRFLFLFGSIPL